MSFRLGDSQLEMSKLRLLFVDNSIVSLDLSDKTNLDGVEPLYRMQYNIMSSIYKHLLCIKSEVFKGSIHRTEGVGWMPVGMDVFFEACLLCFCSFKMENV